MKNIKMIVCDLDGTLLNSDKKVSEFSVQTLRKFREQGIIFTIASGRFKELILYLLDKWNLDDIVDYICYGNGFGYCNYKTGEDKEFYAIDTSIVDEIAEEFKDYNVGFFYHAGPYLIGSNDNPELHRISKRDNIPYYIKDLDYFRNNKTSKLLIGGEKETIDEIEKIAKHYPNVKDFRGTPYQYEYVDARDSKSLLLSDLLAKLNISTDEIVVFGDMINDRDMLQMTKNSVAMLNGDDNAKSVSNYITKYTNDEDGVAKFLLENIEL